MDLKELQIGTVSLISYLGFKHQVLTKGPEGLSQSEQLLLRGELPVVLGHHNSASYLGGQDRRSTSKIFQANALLFDQPITFCHNCLPITTHTFGYTRSEILYLRLCRIPLSFAMTMSSDAT